MAEHGEDPTVAEADELEEFEDPGPTSLPPAAYLLTWNPARWSWSSERFDEQIAALDRGETVADSWSVANRAVQPGDRFYLVRLGDAPRGVFASGRFTTVATQMPHFDPERAARGDTRHAAGIELIELVNPWSSATLDEATLESELPDVAWSPQSSGTRLPPAAAARVEYLWQTHLHKSRAPSLRLVRDVDQLRASMATFSEALARSDARTKYAIFHPTYFVYDPATDRFAPSKWAAIRGMDALTYAALQQVQREQGASARGFGGGRTAKQLASLLGGEYRPDAELTHRLEHAFESAFGAAAVANRDLSDLSFATLPPDGLVEAAPDVQYWKLAPEVGGTLWPMWREQGIATIGWGALGDLRELDDDRFEKRLAERLEAHPDWGKGGPRQAWRFRHIRVGDRLVANVGTTRVVGIGTVTGEYFYVPGENHGHRLHVRWDDVRERAVAQNGWRRTLVQLSKEDFDAIVDDDAAASPAPETAAPLARGLDFDSIVAALETKQLYFASERVANLLLALQVKRFVILSGISGTGKTRLALELTRLFGPDVPGVRERVEVVPVHPDWTDRRGLLGFYNPLTQQYSTTAFLELLLAAAESARAASSGGRAPEPFFVILDEMNLARVEHYFADFLSAMESGEAIELHSDVALELGETEQGVVIPRKLVVPHNLFFIGTVNVDETTYLFSPKVLDRAFTLEFNEVDLAGYGRVAVGEERVDASPLDLDRFDGRLRMGRLPGPSDWSKLGELEDGRLRDVVVDVNRLLQAENRHFGYRVANEIGRFVTLAVEQAGTEAAWPALDSALLQKVLPKLHGTQQELEEVLDRLHAFGLTGEVLEGDAARQRIEESTGAQANAPKLRRFSEKLGRMRRRLSQQGFASFIE